MKAKILIATLGLAGVVTAGAAYADKRCDTRVSDWRPRSAVVQMAESKGWQVDRIHVDDGCYELRVTDADGQRLKVKVDPATLDIVSLKRRGDGHGRDMRRGDDDEDRGGRHERRRYRGGDGDDERRGERNDRGRAPQALGPAEPEAPAQTVPPPSAPASQPPAPDGGSLIGKPKAQIR